MNGNQLSSVEFELIKVDLIIHGSFFKDTHLVAKYLVKLNHAKTPNTKNELLSTPKIFHQNSLPSEANTKIP